MNDHLKEQSQGEKIDPATQAIHDALVASGAKVTLGHESDDQVKQRKAEKVNNDEERQERWNAKQWREIEALKAKLKQKHGEGIEE